MNQDITFEQLIYGVFGSTYDAVPYPSGFLKTFRRFWVQNSIFVPENQLDQIELKSSALQGSSSDAVGATSGQAVIDATTFQPFTANRSKLTAIIDSFEQTLPPLCPVLSQIVDKHFRTAAGKIGGVSTDESTKGATSSFGVADASKGTTTGDESEVRKCKIALRDLGIAYEELAKLPLAVNKELFVNCGLSLEVSTRIAGSIYKRHREEKDENEVQILTPRSTAVKANERFDRSVSFQRCRISPDDIKRYLPSIAHNTELRSLDLSFNNIHIKGAKALADTLAGLPNLSSLSLSGNNLQFEGIRLVCSSLQRRAAMEFLDLSNNNGGSQTGTAVGPGISVRKLCLAGNHITSSGIMALIPVARSAHSLVLSSNNFGIADGNPSGLSDVDTAGKLLVTLINTCDHLSFLDISNNNLSSSASKMILENSIMNHPSLTGLALALNAFPEDLLLNTCFGSPQLVELDLAEKSKALSEAIAGNKVKMLGFRTFLTELGLPNWTNQHVNDALTFLMRRRDIAVQVPVNGALLTTIKTLSSSPYSPTVPRGTSSDASGALYVNSSMDTSHITYAIREDFDQLCDFLDGFRPNNGDIILASGEVS